ncbi:putative uncharacterized protein DDB_G0292292 [Contarinia nasturtii]|uniref:putative uncharacterized protein DDB_G0292292 n=1 Tax=Contarinia nasturtii TaxID=265458 RepID=UPI0012D3A0BB|nr:putative uncharacterized protein DDB_G0292292 [Contarinia nasturtii]XP_031623580.1 putative uncharacterized protein DDB_G0292292 [Contarinia nasturtii]
MDYGCDVSNRYTGYLDSSDHGNPMSTSIRKKKGKAKKKRKSPNKNPSENLLENIETTISNPPTEIFENQQTFSNDNKCDTSYEQENVLHETDSTCPKSSTSCGSPIQSDISREEVKLNDEIVVQVQEPTITPDGINVNETKWSEICFEEEKNLMTLESHSNTDADTQRTLDVSECIQDVFNEHRIYPTIYFYNSNFGNRNRRFIEWNDSGRHSNNESEFNNRNINYYNSDHGNNGNNNNNNGLRDEERKKKRKNRNGRHRKKNTSTDGDSHDVSGETRSNDEQPAKDSPNDSTEQAPIVQDANSTQNTNESNQREFNNRYNRWKHGLPPRTFNRRRSDFVRNV